jgi:hypothetical protein
MLFFLSILNSKKECLQSKYQSWTSIDFCTYQTGPGFGILKLKKIIKKLIKKKPHFQWQSAKRRFSQNLAINCI